MSFLTDTPAAPPPPPPPPAPPTFADATVKRAGAAQRAAAAAQATMGDTTKTGSQGAPDPTTTKGSKSLFGG